MVVHLIGAMLAFGFGTVYECIQSYITYKMHPEVNGKYIFHVRLAISLSSIAVFIGGKLCISWPFCNFFCDTAFSKFELNKFGWMWKSDGKACLVRPKAPKLLSAY